MADPLSVTASVATLVVISSQIVKTVNDVHKFYIDAPLIIASIASECTIVQASLAALQNLLVDPGGAERLPGNVMQALDTSLVGCGLTLSVIDKELSKYGRDAESSSRDVVRKFRFTFEKTRFDELLAQVRAHQIALTLLLTTVQAQSMNELRQSADAHYLLLEKIAERARSLWQESRDGRDVPDSVVGGSDSVFEITTMVSDTRFDFDSIIMNSQAYRRSMMTLKLYDARKQAQLTQESLQARNFCEGERDNYELSSAPASSALKEAEESCATMTRIVPECETALELGPEHAYIQSLVSVPPSPYHLVMRTDAISPSPNTQCSESVLGADGVPLIQPIPVNGANHQPPAAEVSEPQPPYAEFLHSTLPQIAIESLTDGRPTQQSELTITPRPYSALGFKADPASVAGTPPGLGSTGPLSQAFSTASTLSPRSTGSVLRSASDSTNNTSVTPMNPVFTLSSVGVPPSRGPISLVPLRALVIDDTFCGKSAMCQRLTEGVYWADHYNQDPFNTHTTSFTHSGRRYYIDLLDQPGHVSMNKQPIVQLNASINVVLMCFAIDSIESLENLQFVMERLLISTFLGVPALLIGCKTDLRLSFADSSSSQLVEWHQAQATQAVLHAVDYLECSAATSRNITDVLLRVAHWAMQHQSYVSGLSKSKRLFRRSSISRLNIQETKNQILAHSCDFRQEAP